MAPLKSWKKSYSADAPSFGHILYYASGSMPMHANTASKRKGRCIPPCLLSLIGLEEQRKAPSLHYLVNLFIVW